MTTAGQRELQERSKQLYERYGKPLEREHWGAYVAIFPDGQTFVGSDLQDVADRAFASFGPGSFLFRVGQRVVWKFR